MGIKRLRKSYSALTGRFASHKNCYTLFFESSLERDAMYILELDDQILGFKEQPVTIEFLDEGGRQRKYTPDLLIYYKDSPSASDKKLIEVKPQNE